MYAKGPIEIYLNDLAARKSAPGGGSAAALEGSIGAALMSMVANYTDGAQGILKKTEEARKRLQALIDTDIEAYGKLSRALKGARLKGQGSGNEAVNLDEMYKEALMPPYEVCKISAEMLRICKKLVECGNRNLITDTAIAAICLEGAFFSAKFNVYINLKYIKDMDFIEEIHKVLQPMEEELPKLKEEILERCEEVIR